MLRLSAAVVTVTLLAGVLPASLAASRAGAASTVTCKPVTGTYWPGIHGDLLDCTGGNPQTDGAATILSVLEGLHAIAAGQILSQQGVKVFYFTNRAASNEYFKDYPGFRTNSARCGNTSHPALSSNIFSAVWKECTLREGGKTTRTPNLSEVTLHEIGHAYDFALAKAHHVMVAPSTSTAFRAEISADLKFDNATWAADRQSAKWAYICSLFSTVKPSALEISLGAEPGAVCAPTPKLGLIPVKGFRYFSPQTIIQKKMPYFLGPLPLSDRWMDAWAQGFAVHKFVLGGPQAALPFTDYALPKLLNKCTYNIIGFFQQYGKPTPTYPSGCPPEPTKAYYEN